MGISVRLGMESSARHECQEESKHVSSTNAMDPRLAKSSTRMALLYVDGKLSIFSLWYVRAFNVELDISVNHQNQKCVECSHSEG